MAEFVGCSLALGAVVASGQVTAITDGIPPGSQPVAITAGSAGRTWFTPATSSQIGAIARGATTTTTVSAAETPATFLNALADAIRTGDTAFLVSRLNGAVIKRFGETECRRSVATFHDPTAEYTVVSVGKAGPFVYATPGKTALVNNVVPVVVNAVRDGSSFHATVHLAESGKPVSYSWFTDCSETTPATSTTGLSRFAGTYTGTWNNKTFGSTGPTTIVVIIKGNSAGSPVTVDLTLGGEVFGGSAPAPEKFTGRVEPSGLEFSGTSAVFGHLVWHVAADGALTATGIEVPGGRVSSFTAMGSFTASGLSLTYKVSLVGGTRAVGIMRASKS